MTLKTDDINRLNRARLHTDGAFVMFTWGAPSREHNSLFGIFTKTKFTWGAPSREQTPYSANF